MFFFLPSADPLSLLHPRPTLKAPARLDGEEKLFTYSSDSALSSFVALSFSPFALLFLLNVHVDDHGEGGRERKTPSEGIQRSTAEEKSAVDCGAAEKRRDVKKEKGGGESLLHTSSVS